MDPSNEGGTEPRREAMPLKFDELTEEQRSAGEEATRLLRGMARQPWKPAPRQPPAHSYLPVIYREAHYNQVILLDGARGSGKSALLVTLLDAYGRALTEQRVPPKYEAWLTPADRIIPVGLIDLQPLPASTHLLFHLVASLERVVEAMETRREHREHPRQGVPAGWHPEEENESRSRQTWRRFARVAASGWDDNLEARKGKLDPEAFAVEVEQGELQRLDVTQAFREFMDALVNDYQAWSHWQSGAPPLFVLAIDDADMNPELSVPLLELVRKLWHPRLAFLLTGDTDLFIERLTAPPPPAPPSRPGIMPLRPPAELDAPRRRQLGMDLYSKAIPLKHRCRLKELAPNQRLVKGPEITRILERIRVPTQLLAPGRRSGSLLDYFSGDSQLLDALPGRLRALGELADSLRPLTTGAETADATRASSRTVERIWQFALRTEPGASRWESVVRVDAATCRLRIEEDLVVDWEVDPRVTVETGHAQLSFEVPLRAVVRDIDLGAQPTAALLLAASVIADSGRSIGRTPLALGGMTKSLLAHATLEGFVVGPRTYVWPLPDWGSFLDIDLLRTDWNLALVLKEPPSPDAHLAERMAKEFLRTVLDVGLGRPTNAGKPDQEDSLSWTALATRLRLAATLKKGEQHSARRLALARWARGRAGLLAAPESGLPASVANALLQALRVAFKGTSWQRVRQALLDARRERLAGSFQAERRQAADTEALDNIIHAIDQQFLAHQFRHWVEHVEGDTSEQEMVFSHLQTVLQNTYLPFLDSHIGTRSTPNTLATYLTPLRLKWLKKGPAPMLQHIRNELDSFQQISDAGTLALTRFWKAAYEAAGASDVADALQSTPDGLTIAEPYRRLLDQKTAQTTAAGTPLLVFIPGEHLGLALNDPKGTLSPFIESKSAGRAANRVLDVVLRMAYDHEKDRSEHLDAATPPAATPPVGWKGVELRFQGAQPFHPWPVPNWSTLFEWESLEQSWLEALKLAKEAIAAEFTPADLRIVDALAFWMLSVCHDMQRRRPSSLGLKLNPSESDWRTVITQQRKELRASLYDGWRRRLPLMAAPESGLSRNAAATILNSAFRDEVHPAIRDEFSENAHDLRHTRMVEAGIPTKHVDLLLSRIDRANPDHPWVKKFGVWKSTEGTSSP